MLDLQLGFPSREFPDLVLLEAQPFWISQRETPSGLSAEAWGGFILQLKRIILNQLLTLPQLLQESLVLPFPPCQECWRAQAVAAGTAAGFFCLFLSPWPSCLP